MWVCLPLRSYMRLNMLVVLGLDLSKTMLAVEILASFLSDISTCYAITARLRSGDKYACH
jgi:hypothetical protein